MRRLKVIEYVTLDGVIEDPGPAGDFKYRGWTVPFWNDEMAAAQSKELFASDVLLLGRVTYEEFVAAWPLRSGDAFTDKMNSMKKLVASRRTATPLEWNATLIKGDVVAAV
jgi:dihydrofolate reductase